MKPKYANFTIVNTTDKNFKCEIDMRIYYDTKSIDMEPIVSTIGWNSSGGFNIRNMSLDAIDVLLDTMEEARSIAVKELESPK